METSSFVLQWCLFSFIARRFACGLLICPPTKRQHPFLIYKTMENAPVSCCRGIFHFDEGRVRIYKHDYPRAYCRCIFYEAPQTDANTASGNIAANPVCNPTKQKINGTYGGYSFPSTNHRLSSKNR